MRATIFACSLALLMGSVAAASAEDQSQPDRHAAFKQACGADIQSFCASAQSRDDRHACIKANKDKFSDACKTFIASHHEHEHGDEHAETHSPGGAQ